MPPLRVDVDHDLVRQLALLGQGSQVGRAFHGDIAPGRHPVTDAGPGMVPFEAGIGQVKHQGIIQIKIGGANNAESFVVKFISRDSGC